MSNKRLDIDRLQDKIEKSKVPSFDSGLQLLPVSENEFQARWSLDTESLDSGLRAASQHHDETHLVLRAYSLPMDASGINFSSDWHDYSIDSTENSAYFTLPTPSGKINAAIGLMNKSGRFSPLARGEAISLPFAPAPIANKPEIKAESENPTDATGADAPSGPKPFSPTAAPLNEAEITERLQLISGLPESFKARTDALSNTKEPEIELERITKTGADKTSDSTPTQKTPSSPLDEADTLNTVRHKMAIDPDPAITQSESNSSSNSSNSTFSSPAETAESPKHETGASEQLASQWEDIWTGNAPIEIRAEFVLTGKIAPGMKLLLGNEILEPNPGGFVVWKRKLDSFSQVWPLLQAALATPTVAAAPSLEFFKDANSFDRLLELHAALEIEGRVTDSDYHTRLPADLRLEPDGTFKLNRMLPEGAVILPGLSLVTS